MVIGNYVDSARIDATPLHWAAERGIHKIIQNMCALK